MHAHPSHFSNAALVAIERRRELRLNERQQSATVMPSQE
jgi:hypothetical protein